MIVPQSLNALNRVDAMARQARQTPLLFVLLVLGGVLITWSFALRVRA